MKQWGYTSHLPNSQTDPVAFRASMHCPCLTDKNLQYGSGIANSQLQDLRGSAVSLARCPTVTPSAYTHTTYLSHGAFPPSFNSLYHPAIIHSFTMPQDSRTVSVNWQLNQTPRKKISTRNCLHWVGLWHVWEGSYHSEWYHFLCTKSWAD